MDEKPAPDPAVAFDTRVGSALATLPPAEQKMARFFIEQKHAVLLGSAAQIAEQAGASDATVVRTARSLGFDSLAALREVLLADLTGTISPSGRLKRTLDETSSDAGRALDHVVDIHVEVLEALKRGDIAAGFTRAVALLGAARCRHVFGIGPSGALAEYASLQFNRIGSPTRALSASGVALADQLLWLEEGDAVLMLAYAPLYREVTVVLDEARRKGVPTVLISDSLGPFVADKVAEVLAVPRGKAGHLAMHAGTMVLIEAMIVGLAAHHRDAALDRLDRLSSLRTEIDRDWSKRGHRKKK